MGRLVRNELIAGSTVNQYRYLIRHGPRRQEYGGFMFQQAAGPHEQSLDRGIFLTLLVTHLGCRDSLAHGLRRSSLGITVKIDFNLLHQLLHSGHWNSHVVSSLRSWW